jgi:hypothetical protein
MGPFLCLDDNMDDEMDDELDEMSKARISSLPLLPGIKDYTMINISCQMNNNKLLDIWINRA